MTEREYPEHMIEGQVSYWVSRLSRFSLSTQAQWENDFGTAEASLDPDVFARVMLRLEETRCE